MPDAVPWVCDPAEALVLKDNSDNNTSDARGTRIRRYGRFLLTPFWIMQSLAAGYLVMLGFSMLLLRGPLDSVLVGYIKLHVVFVAGALSAGVLAALLECWNARKSGFRPRAAGVGMLVAYGGFALMICTSGRGLMELPWFALSVLVDIPILLLAGLFGWWMSKRARTAH